MNEEILISVIVPAYNVEPYIARCLDSILNQTHRNLEVLVIDDGSTDHTSLIIDEYAKKDSRIKVTHKKNGGVSSARIEGIQQANGDYVGFVDSDDYIESDMYEFLLSNAIMYNADISHCGYQRVFPKKRIDYYYNTGKVVLQDNMKGLHDLLTGEFIEPGLCNKLFNKKLIKDFEKSELWDSEIKINEDLLANYILFKKSKKSIYEDKCPYYYMMREGSASTSKINEYKLRDPFNVMKKINEDVQDISELRSITRERLIRLMIDISTLSKKSISDNFCTFF